MSPRNKNGNVKKKVKEEKRRLDIRDAMYEDDRRGKRSIKATLKRKRMESHDEMGGERRWGERNDGSGGKRKQECKYSKA